MILNEFHTWYGELKSETDSGCTEFDPKDIKVALELIEHLYNVGPIGIDADLIKIVLKDPRNTIGKAMALI